MKITVYTVAIDNDNGTFTEAFATPEERNEWAWTNVVALYLNEGETLDDLRMRYDTAKEAMIEGEYVGYQDTYGFYEHEIEVAQPKPEPANKFLLALDLSSGIDLQHFDTEAARDDALWELAFNSTVNDHDTVEKFRAEYEQEDYDLSDAMEDAEIGFLTDDVRVEPVREYIQIPFTNDHIGGFAVIYDIDEDDTGNLAEQYYEVFDSPAQAAQMFREAFPTKNDDVKNARLVQIIGPIDDYIAGAA